MSHDEEIASLTTRLRAAESDSKAVRELMNVYNLGGMTDYNDGPMKRALAAESRERAARELLTEVRDHIKRGDYMKGSRDDYMVQKLDAALRAGRGHE